MNCIVIRVATAVMALSALVTASGCGGSDNTSACSALKKDLNEFTGSMKDLTTLGAAPAGNAAAAKAKINQTAAKVRADGKKGDTKVAAAADQLATAMENMTKPGGANGSAVTGFQGAGNALQSACG